MAHEDRTAKGRGGRPSLKRAAEIDARLLSAAATLFLERGVDGTSLEAVAAAAAVGKPTLYARYPDKSALFAAVIRTNVAAALPPIDGPHEGASPEDRLRHVGRAVIDGAMQPLPLSLMRLYIAEAPRHGALIREVDRMGREAALDTIAAALVDTQDADVMARARKAAGVFLDVAFVPHQVRMLLGDPPDEADDLHPTLKERIDHAVAILAAMGLLRRSK